MSTTTTKPAAPGPDDFKTEQMKGKPDPVTPTKEPTEKIKAVDVARSEPYPTGSPPDPEDQFFAAHGYRRAKA